MHPSAALVDPHPLPGAAFHRSDSLASSVSTNSAGSGASLSRRSATRTRSVAHSKPQRKSSSRSVSSKHGSDAGESFLDFDDAPPVPPLLHDEPEGMLVREREREVRRARRRSRTVGPESRRYEQPRPQLEQDVPLSAPAWGPPEVRNKPGHEDGRESDKEARKARRRSRTLGPGERSYEGRQLLPDPSMSQIGRSWSALDIRNPPEQSRGRQAKSDTGSLKAPKDRLRGLSLPRHPFAQSAHSDESSQPSPQTPHGFGNGPSVRIAGPSRSHFRDSVLTQVSATSSSVYPASTSAGSRTESSLPYTEDQDEAEMSYPDIVSPENPDFDADDVSYRLRLLLNNSYFLPPAHAKPTPMALSPQPQDAVQKSKPASSGFLDFFRIGKSKSKPTSPVPGSPPALDSNGPILRTTSDSPSASGLLSRVQAQQQLPPALVLPGPPPASRVVVLRERMDDLVTAAKEAEKEIRNKADARKPKTPSATRDRFLDDVIDPTDAVDLPPPSADALFAVQASAMFGLGPQDSVGAAELADRLIPGSPGIWSMSSEEDAWRKDLLREAVSHSLGNTPESSFSSHDGHQDPGPSRPQSEATFPSPAQMEIKRRVGQRIVEDFSIQTVVSDASPPASPVEVQTKQTVLVPSRSSVFSHNMEKSPIALTHPLLTAADPPVRAETPAHMHTPLAPAPRRQLVNPLYSLSEPDLPDSLSKAQGPSSSSSQKSLHTVRKTASTPGLSGSEDTRTQRATMSLSPPPIPEHPGIHRGLTPAPPKNLEGMPSFTTSRTESDSRYSDDSMSFRTPMDTDIEMSGARPSMTISVQSGRPSISVSEYSAPSPTASAFRDAVFGSCRPPSTVSRRSATSVLEPMRPEAPRAPPPATPRSAATSPPPRVSSSVPPTVLPPPPRPPAIRPTYRPSISTHDSQSPGGHSGPSVMLSSPTSDVTQDVSVQLSFSSSAASSPSAPIAARRGQGSPLSLRIPAEYAVPAIHSAPAPSSPTDFFDRIQSTIANAMDDLETSDEETSDEELSLEGAQHARSRYDPPPPPRPPLSPELVETAAVFVEPRTQAISNRASSSSSRPSIMRLGNHSTPQLSPAPSFVTAEPMPQFTFDRKKPVGNVADMTRRSFSSVRSVKKGKGILAAPKAPILPIGPVPSSPSYGPGAGISSKDKRPATAPSADGRLRPDRDGGRKIQRESIQKFDGMLLQHLAAERDRIKQITSSISNSASSSPVQTFASEHPFAGPSASSAPARSKSRSRSRARPSTRS
ncbi:hypothetical protein C8Q78DRAFT_1078402 [Trametes maxima]|nr:hypothetical protein C8Q78DRAFT_1078402 [Trametes maxima]